MLNYLLIGLEKTAEELTEKRRAVLAKVYNEKLTTYDWNLPPPANQIYQNESIYTRIKLEKNVEELQGAIQHLQNRIRIEDLTEDEVVDLQLVLMSDENEIQEPFANEYNDDENHNESGSMVENA